LADPNPLMPAMAHARTRSTTRRCSASGRSSRVSWLGSKWTEFMTIRMRSATATGSVVGQDEWGDLPPSSSATRLRVVPAAVAIRRTVDAEPE